MSVKVKDIMDITNFGTDFRFIKESYTEKDGYSYETVFDCSDEERTVTDEEFMKIREMEVVELSTNMDVLEITYKE